MTKIEKAEFAALIGATVKEEVAKATYTPNGAKATSVAKHKGNTAWPARGVLEPSVKFEDNGATLSIRCDLGTDGEESTTKKSNVLSTNSGGRFQDLGVEDGRHYRLMLKLIATKE